jgi:hypothetical protein
MFATQITLWPIVQFFGGIACLLILIGWGKKTATNVWDCLG